MTASDPQPSTIGFLSVLEHDLEFYGGLLVLNTSGRPIEFHCTAPVKPTRSHQVLYGPTLAAYVLADHIGPTMIRNVKSRPLLFCTDRIELMEIDAKIAETIFVPTAAASEGEDHASGGNAGKQSRWDSEHQHVNGPQFGKLLSLHLGEQVVGIHLARQDARQTISQQLAPYLEQIELTEPFERIHNAIRESHGIKPAEAPADQNEVRV